MKILFLTNLYPPNVFGGYERLCYEVASALQAKGHEVTVLTSSYGKKGGNGDLQPVRRELFLFATEGNIYTPFTCAQAQREEYEAGNRARFEAAVDEIKPDILFVWNLYFLDQGLLAAIERSPLPKTYLLTDNWLIAQLNPEFIGAYFAKNVLGKSLNPTVVGRAIRFWAGYLRRLFSRNVRVMKGRAIFPSKFMRQLYGEAGFRFKGGEAICYHGVRFLHPSGGGRINRSELIDRSEVRLLFAGRVVEIKGVHTAIEAVREVRKRHGNLRVALTIVGDTQDQVYYGKLERLIDSLGVRDSVVFRSAVAEDELFDLFQQHDIYLFPSLYEPFSLTLILALESGIPTIASDAGGNVEIVEQGKTGLLFRAGNQEDLADHIGSLAASGDLRDRISQAATAHAGKFTFDSMISRIEHELQQAIG